VLLNDTNAVITGISVLDITFDVTSAGATGADGYLTGVIALEATAHGFTTEDLIQITEQRWQIYTGFNYNGYYKVTVLDSDWFTIAWNTFAGLEDMGLNYNPGLYRLNVGTNPMNFPIKVVMEDWAPSSDFQTGSDNLTLPLITKNKIVL